MKSNRTKSKQNLKFKTCSKSWNLKFETCWNLWKLKFLAFTISRQPIQTKPNWNISLVPSRFELISIWFGSVCRLYRFGLVSEKFEKSQSKPSVAHPYSRRLNHLNIHESQPLVVVKISVLSENQYHLAIISSTKNCIVPSVQIHSSLPPWIIMWIYGEPVISNWLLGFFSIFSWCWDPSELGTDIFWGNF